MPFKIVRNDITKMRADAIVNTANPEPVCASGTDSAVYQAAGMEELLAERAKIGRLKAGEAAITPAFSLDAKYIIHTVGPIWQGGQCEEARQVRLCYENSLKLALEYGCESIAFPLISTGIYGFPKNEALQIALSVIRDFLSREDMLVYLVVFDKESFAISGKLFTDIDSYIDEKYVAAQTAAEYSKNPPCGQALRGVDRSVSLPEFSMPQMCNAAPPPPPAAAAPMAAMPQKPRAEKKSKKLFSRQPKNNRAERSLEDVMTELGETFQERLLRLIDERGMTDVEVYKKANLDRKLFSKIRCNVNYRPKKMTALALAIALELNLDETKDLLSRAELALSPSSKFDLIIEYFIDREVYDVYTINLALFQHEQPILGE